METLAARLVETLINHGYIVILMIMVFEEAGVPLPIPGDGLLLLAGYLASLGTLNFFVCLLLTDLGALVGGTILYWVSRRGGRALLVRYGRYVRLHEHRLDQLSSFVGRLGPFGPGVSRLIPGLRIYTSAIAGLALVPYPLFLLNVAWGCTLWAIVFLWLGDVLGYRWRAYIHLSQQISLYAAVAVGLSLMFWWFVRPIRMQPPS